MGGIPPPDAAPRHHGTAKSSPPAREIAVSGPFPLVVAGVGFEPTKTEPTVYRPSLLPEAGATGQRVRDTRLDSGPSPSAMRPCVRVPGPLKSTDATVGAVTLTVRLASCLDLQFHVSCSL